MLYIVCTGLSIDDFKTLTQRFLTHLHVQLLVHGNTLQTEVIDLVELLTTNFLRKFTAGLQDSQLTRPRTVAIPAGMSCWFRYFEIFGVF